MRCGVSIVKRQGRRRVVCGLATVAATFAAAVSAHGATYVYVSSAGSGEVFQYSVDSGGALTPLATPSIAAGPRPNGVVVSPTARWVYVTNINGVATFALGHGGLLSPSGSTVPAEVPTSPALSPIAARDPSLYTVDAFGTLSQWDIGTDGSLTPKNPPSIRVVAPGVATPTWVAVSPDGRSAYVAYPGPVDQPANLIYQYDVDANDGTLSPKNPPTVATGDGPVSGAVSADGKFVYVANSGSNTISQLNVDEDNGTLSLNRSVGGGDTPAEVAVSPDGESVYMTNIGNPLTREAGSVLQYDVANDGSLSPKHPHRSVSAGSHPLGVAVSSDGSSVYVSDTGTPNGGGGAVYQFDVDANTGALSAKTPASVAAGQSPAGLAVSPAFATAGADVLTGTAGDDRICGLDGSDKISGLGGDDTLYGDRCGSRPSPTAAGVRAGAAARAGHDLLRGGSGRDRLYGGRGRDRLRGGAGRDRLRAGGGADRLCGGPGRDTLHVRGGGRDRVDCGAGRDTVRADERDILRRCERVIRR